MLSRLYCTILVHFLFFNGLVQSQSIESVRDIAYPNWLKSEDYRTDQTSGIAFVNSQSCKKTFILADDLGSLHRFVILEDSIFKFYPIRFSQQVIEYLKDFPKLDFEEIVYDRYEDKFYLSIEGNTEAYADWVGIYEIKFNVSIDTLVKIQKINFHPEEQFLKYTAWNIGYEGLGVDSRYFYLGLEGFLNGKTFTDSTVLFIADKSSKEIIKEIGTKQLGIGSITGLFCDKDISLWLLDRNNLKIFHLEFDDELNIKSLISFNFEPIIPNYTNLNYVGSYESITMDEEENIYIIDDPWRQFFVPPENILSQLDEKTIDNFKKHIPIIDRLKIKTKGAKCGPGN